MLGLGIESTAHTFSCAIIEKKGKKGKILSDVRKIYRPADGEGIHPREASRHHIEHSSSVLSECLKEANSSIKDLDEWDSLSAMVLIGYVSDNFDVTLNADDIESITTFNSLIETIGEEKFI